MPDHGAARLRVGDLLVATPALQDPNFEHTVVLVLDLDENGALGVVLNRPSTVQVRDVLPGWDDVVRTPDVLFQGGPVSTDSALAVGASMTYGVDPNVEPVGFRRLYDDVGIVDLDTPTEIVVPALTGMRVFAGYAGWGDEQLAGGDRRGVLVRRAVPGRRPVRHRPGRAVDAGAAPSAGRARLGLDPTCRPDHELTLDSVIVSTQMSPGAETIEDRRTVPTDDGDHERFSHYVEKDKLTEAMVMGTPVVALCGKAWVPEPRPGEVPGLPGVQGRVGEPPEGRRGVAAPPSALLTHAPLRERRD